MDSYQFEELIADIWDARGYDTTVRQASRDRGVDVEAIIKSPIKHKTYIQAKRYKENNKVGSQKIRNYATLYQQDDSVDLVVVVTSSTFTKQAVKLAWDLNVEILDCKDILRKIIENNMLLDDIGSKSDYSPNENRSYSYSFDKNKLDRLFTPDKQTDSVSYSLNSGNRTYDITINTIEEQFNYELMNVRIKPKVPIKKLVGVGKRSIDVRDNTTLLKVKISDKNELVGKIEQILSKI